MISGMICIRVGWTLTGLAYLERSILRTAMLAQNILGGMNFIAKPCRSGAQDKDNQKKRQIFKEW